MTPTSPSIAIIGGGPSGLVFARLLEQSGITDYVVFERDASATPGPWQQGGTLDLHTHSGQLALQRAGLFDDFSRRLARWDGSCIHIVDPAGTTVVRAGEGHDRPEIDRLQLRQLLLQSVPAHKIRWGHAVKTVEKSVGVDGEAAFRGNGCIIRFTNGTSASGFQLIVGADGAWSKARHLLTPAKPFYSGKMFIEGRISHDNPIYAAASAMAGPGNMMAMGDYKMLGMQQVSDRTYRFYCGLKVPEDFYHRRTDGSSSKAAATEDKTEEVRRLLLSSDDFYATWGPQLKTFIEHAEGPFRPWPLYSMKAEAVDWERSVAPGVTLLGDAAHLSTPFAGEGVNCSMHDAVVLAECIVNHCGSGFSFTNDDRVAALESALAEYEKNMFKRGRERIRESTENEGMMYSENSAARFLDFVNNAV